MALNVGRAIAQPSQGTLTHAAQSGDMVSSTMQPVPLAATTIFQNAIGGRIALDEKSNRGEIAAKLTQISALRQNSYYLGAKGVAEGMPAAVAAFWSAQSAVNIFGEGGLDKDGKVYEAYEALAGDGSAAPGEKVGDALADLKAECDKVDINGDVPGAANEYHITKNFKTSGGCPLNGPAGPAMKQLLISYGTGPQGIDALAKKMHAEANRLGHDRMIAGVIPLEFRSNNGFKSVTSTFEFGSGQKSARTIRM